MYDTLIEPRDLAAAAQDGHFRVVDCRFALSDPGYGPRVFDAGHIPGAVYADLDRDLAAPPGAGGRHPLPDRRFLTDRLNAWGISNDSQIVVYDDAGGMYACRLWWLARWLGHKSVAVLNGGLQAWVDAGHPMNAGVASVPGGNFHAREPLTRCVDAEAILAGISAGDGPVLLDARARERFVGEVEPIDAKAGHIPGACCAPFADNLEDGRFKPADALKERFAAFGNLNAAACYCGSGVTATHNILAMRVAGYPEPALYPGSWSEWINDDNRPIEP
ncbi:MAG: sulfurtransferase [Gammaproteobacteria bacterium]|nr:sulfurtransferase [Gammaproteobacteria bacterium]